MVSFPGIQLMKAVRKVEGYSLVDCRVFLSKHHRRVVSSV